MYQYTVRSCVNVCISRSQTEQIMSRPEILFGRLVRRVWAAYVILIWCVHRLYGIDMVLRARMRPNRDTSEKCKQHLNKTQPPSCTQPTNKFKFSPTHGAVRRGHDLIRRTRITGKTGTIWKEKLDNYQFHSSIKTCPLPASSLRPNPNGRPRLLHAVAPDQINDRLRCFPSHFTRNTSSDTPRRGYRQTWAAVRTHRKSES